jgi:hypothetical protein
MAGSFRDDLGASLDAWRTHPGLPITTLLVAGAVEGSASAAGSASLVGLPLLLFFAGFMGTQRLWYWRAFENERMTASKVWTSAWRFFPRFCRLALVTGVGATPPAVALGLASEWAEWVALLVAWVFIDVVITFATPALVFSTRRVSEALPIGWDVLRRHWPEVRWYALAPPLVLLVVRASQATTADPWVTSVVAASGWMLNLMFKGAQLRAYVRHYDGPVAEPRPKDKAARRRRFDRSLADTFGQGPLSA